MRQKVCFGQQQSLYHLYKGRWKVEQTAAGTCEYTLFTTAPAYLVFLAVHFKHGDGAFPIDFIARWVFPHTFSLQENGIHIRGKSLPQQDCCLNGKLNHRSNSVSGDDRQLDTLENVRKFFVFCFFFWVKQLTASKVIGMCLRYFYSSLEQLFQIILWPGFNPGD